MIFSDIPSPADLPSPKRSRFGFAQAGAGFAKAGNRFPLFGIMFSVIEKWCPGAEWRKSVKSRIYRVPLCSHVPLYSKDYF
jgi:hypothetical protein